MIGTNRSLKDKRKKIKQQRQDQGNAANGTFKGPWAEQQDENFVNVELTEEQREMLNQLELRRKQKVEEIAKKEETFEPYMEHHAKMNPELMGRPFTAPPPISRTQITHATYPRDVFTLSTVTPTKYK